MKSAGLKQWIRIGVQIDFYSADWFSAHSLLPVRILIDQELQIRFNSKGKFLKNQYLQY